MNGHVDVLVLVHVHRNMKLSVSNWIDQFNELSDILFSNVICMLLLLLLVKIQLLAKGFIFSTSRCSERRDGDRKRKRKNGKCKKTFVKMGEFILFSGRLLMLLLLLLLEFHANWVNWFAKRNTIHIHIYTQNSLGNKTNKPT